ncbi:MAG: DUF4390 domain-containing protein [Vicinamibacterales bacterium]
MLPPRTRSWRPLRAGWLTVFALLVGMGTAHAQETVRIIPLVRDNNVLVTFELTDGFTDQVRDAIHSGLKTTFTFNVELRLDVPAWVDRTIATSVVTNSVEYDNLTRQATLLRTLDGRTEKQDVTSDDALVREWMTTFTRLPLFKTSLLETNREYYVRVVATARPTNGVLLWPWGTGTSGMAKFTFLR